MGKGKSMRPLVYARIRPMIGRDAGQPELFTCGDTTLEYRRKEGGELSKFHLDKVFGVDATQESVYAEIGDVSLKKLRQGFNSTILAYGQTGSGKTFSMEGHKDPATGQYTSRGLIPRLFESVFRMFEEDSLIKQFEVTIQYIELYNEQLQDLLSSPIKKVDVTTDPTGGYQCRDAVKMVCKSAEEAQRVYNTGCKMRATASTKMNESSSRSHALLILSVAWSEQKGKSFGVLNLVDLAGSEGMKKTGATGAKAKEGIKINQSLSMLAHVVKCLGEGASHIPYRDSKLTMMLNKGLGGESLLHIILALSNSAEQEAEGTACLRFGSSCIQMTVNPNANKMEREQAEMRSLIQEQMNEISNLKTENEQLLQALEDAKNAPLIVQQHIAVNKDALRDDLKEAGERIIELRLAIDEKRAEAEALKCEEEALADDPMWGATEEELEKFNALDAAGQAEFQEKRRREKMLERMRANAMNEGEMRALEAELAQIVEIEAKLQKKLTAADSSVGLEEERIRAEIEEKAAEEKMAIEQRAEAMEAELRAHEAKQALLEEETRAREKALQEDLALKEEMMRREEELKKQMLDAAQADKEEMEAALARMEMERKNQEVEIEKARREAERVKQMEEEAQRVLMGQASQAEELRLMREQLEQLEREGMGGGLRRQLSASDFSTNTYKPAEVMIKLAAQKMERQSRGMTNADPMAIGRVLHNLPMLTACNDLRALAELEPANKALFQSLGGIEKMVEYLCPHGPQGPYATHIARTLPCVMDVEGRRLFHAHASAASRDGEVRYTYLLHLLHSQDSDDREHACLAIASAAQDSPETRAAFFKQSISLEVIRVLSETCQQPVPRQRLQRAAVMALAELAEGFDACKETICREDGVGLLLKLLTPSNDPFVVKETLKLIGRITRANASVQLELEQKKAVDVFSALLFAQQLHDVTITELAALALVNLVSESPACLAAVERHPRFHLIRYELLASMARALSSSMTRAQDTVRVHKGSEGFRFWGACAMGAWAHGTAGGDRSHTSFSDNPQFLIRAPAGTHMCIVLQDLNEDKRQAMKIKARPLFLRLCVVAASDEVLSTRRKALDINQTGSKVAPVREGAVQMEPGLEGYLDVAKTLEVKMNVHVKSSNGETAWVVVPHVGCSHQHSNFALSVFADNEVSIEGELQPWAKHVIGAAWSPLACAPNSIQNCLWRNSPQFRIQNTGSSRTPVCVMLSYGERDAALNRKYLQAADGADYSPHDDKAMLSMYVMRSKDTPDKRYVSTLSPQVENYVCHSLVNHTWCVQAGWCLEPGEVYYVIAVMMEGTTHEVPLRLTTHYSPDVDEGEISIKPLSFSAEWFLTALTGRTGHNGSNVLELLPVTGAGSMQAVVVFESDEDIAFCSISTSHEGSEHKRTPAFSQKQAVLPLTLSAGDAYKVTTMCITQRKEAVRGKKLLILVYSTRPLQVTASAGQELHVDDELASQIVCRNTSELVPYGAEYMPEDTLRKEDDAQSPEDESADPRVLEVVVKQLEEQRDSLYAYARDELAGEPPAAIEALRSQKEELASERARLQTDLAQAQAQATIAQERVGQLEAIAEAKAKAAISGVSDSGKLKDWQVQMAADRKVTELSSELASANRKVSELEQQLAHAVRGLEASSSSDSAQPDAHSAQLRMEVSNLNRRLEVAEKEKIEAQRDSATAKLDLAQARGGGGNAETEAELRELQREIMRLQAEGLEAQKRLAAVSKSSACLVQ